MQVREVPTLDRAPEGHPHLHRQQQQHPSHAAHVALDEGEMMDIRQRAYQKGLDDAAFLAEPHQPEFELSPTFYSNPPLQFPRAPLNSWRGRTPYAGYPRGPGRGPHWSQPNQYSGYRQGQQQQQNQHPDSSTHANQHAEFTAYGRDGEPPPAKVMCSRWDGWKCPDPSCQLAHPPGIRGEGGGPKSSY
jgi:hypothetical protein